MLKKISITLLFAAALAIVVPVPFTEVLAGAGDPYPGTVAPDYSYFEYKNFKFEFLGCDYDKVNDATTCSWKATATGTKEISHLLIALRPDLVDSITSHACSDLSCEIFKILDGSGDPSTKIYGKFLGLALIKFIGDFGNLVEVSLTFNGHLAGTEITAAFIKSGRCEIEGNEVICDDSSFGPVIGVGEFCEEKIAGIGTTSGCVNIGEVGAGTIYMGYQREGNGCDVDENLLRLYLNSPQCDASVECPVIDPPGSDPTPEQIAIFQAGCDYGAPVVGCGEGVVGPCVDAAVLTEIICAQPGSNCPECMEVEAGSPTCVKYTLPSGTVYKCCTLDDGTSCSWRDCCKDKDKTAACGY